VWDREYMVRTVKAVRGKEMGLLKASKMFSVPRATLKNYVNNRGKDAEALVTMKMGRKSALSAQS
jgi:transposase